MSSETFNLTRAVKDHTEAMKRVAKALEHSNQLELDRQRIDKMLTDPGEYHDDVTLLKVKEALRVAGVHDVIHTISELQNAGILFRERR